MIVVILGVTEKMSRLITNQKVAKVQMIKGLVYVGKNLTILLDTNEKDQAKYSSTYVKIIFARYDLNHYIKCQLKIPIF